MQHSTLQLCRKACPKSCNFIVRQKSIFAAKILKQLLIITIFWLTLFQTGSGMTLSDGGGPLWPSLIFCYITQQKVALTPKTCSQIKFLIFRHPFTPLFQHSRESFPPFMSVNVDQYLYIETLKIGKTPKGPPFENEKKFCLRFWWNSKHAILTT